MDLDAEQVTRALARLARLEGHPWTMEIARVQVVASSTLADEAKAVSVGNRVPRA